MSNSDPLASRVAAWEARRAGCGGVTHRGRALPSVGDLVLVSDDYLALASHPDVVDAHVRVLRDGGGDRTRSDLFAGGADPRCSLEERLADYLHAPATVLTQSGWATNVGLIQVLAEAGGPVYVDADARATLWAGIQAAGAVARPFAHNDVEHLERLIDRYGPGLIAFETVSGVIGDLCPLTDLVDAAERTGCLLLADESHALGVLGPGGAGLVPALGLSDRVAVRTACLAKAFTARAGLVACSRELAEYLPFHADGAVFSSPPPARDLAGIAAVADLMPGLDDRRTRLVHAAAFLRGGLTDLGYTVAPSESWIVPLQPGTEEYISLLQRLLDARGVFGAPFLPPSVGRNRCVHRLSVHCELTDDDLARVLDACAAVRSEAGVPDWESTRRRRQGR